MMIRKFLNYSSVQQLKFIRHISGIQNLYSNGSVGKKEDDDLSDDLIIIANISKETKQELNNKKIKTLLAHVNLTHKFKHFLNCSEDEATKMIHQNKRLLDLDLATVGQMIEFIFEQNISIRSIINNPWILSMDKQYLRKKLIRVQMFLPHDINDVTPLLQVSHSALNRAVRIVDRERKFMPEGNRIYYLSKRLNVEPALVTKYLSTHMFMFDIQFEMLVENLNIMLEYQIEPINILKDLWAFKYLPKSIRERLERCKVAGKENLKPWMIRCPEDVLENSLKISQDCKDLLGENTIIDYLSERLGYENEAIKTLVERHPAVLKCRVTKVKEVLDYLLDEEQYQPYEVASVIRILTHSLETTKNRLNELKIMGCRPSSLTIVCRSQKEYQKFIKEWIDRSEGF